MADVESADTTSGGHHVGDIDVTMPANIGVDDYVVVVMAVDGDGDGFSTEPAGWTSIAVAESLGASCYAYYAKNPASGTHNWVNTNTEQISWMAMRISGADGATFLDVPAVVGSDNGGSSTTGTAPSITPANADTLVLHCMARDRAGWSAIPATSEGSSAQSTDCDLAVSSGTFGDSATGTKAFTLDGGAGNRYAVGMAIAIRNAVTATTGSGDPSAQSSSAAGAGEREVTGTAVLAGQAAAVAGAGLVQVSVQVELTVATGRELRDENNALVANLNGIIWEWYDTPGSTAGAPVDSGAFNTNADGEGTISVLGSSLTSGQFGQLVLYHPSDVNIRGSYRVPVS